MKPLVCDALFATEHSRAERILTWIPILGWALASVLEKARFHPIVRDIERQLRSRPDTKEQWGPPGPQQEASQRLRPILAEELGWPNDHFIPDDPFGIVFWAHQNGLDDVSAVQRIESEFGVSFPGPELERLQQHGTLGDFADLLLSLPRVHEPSHTC